MWWKILWWECLLKFANVFAVLHYARAYAVMMFPLKILPLNSVQLFCSSFVLLWLLNYKKERFMHSDNCGRNFKQTVLIKMCAWLILAISYVLKLHLQWYRKCGMKVLKTLGKAVLKLKIWSQHDLLHCYNSGYHHNCLEKCMQHQVKYYMSNTFGRSNRQTQLIMLGYKQQINGLE